MKDPYTKETDKRFTLRIDNKLYERVKESAQSNKRSVAKEIEYILELFVNENIHK